LSFEYTPIATALPGHNGHRLTAVFKNSTMTKGNTGLQTEIVDQQFRSKSIGRLYHKIVTTDNCSSVFRSCEFQTIPITYSIRFRSLIPDDPDQGFHAIPITESRAFRSTAQGSSDA
jgi:hypothetical protein